MWIHRVRLILCALLAAGVSTTAVKAQPLTLRAGILGGAAGIVTDPDHRVISTAGQPAAGFALGVEHEASLGIGTLIPIPSARDKKETARALLVRNDDHPDPSIVKDLEMALKSLDQSLDVAFWSSDGNHVFDVVVFDKEFKAIRDLPSIVNDENAGTPTRADVLAAILRLVGADRILALIAIREAAGACENVESPEERTECDKGVEKAQQTLVEADELVAGDAYDKAVQQYRKAWELAVATQGVGKSGGVSVDGGETPTVYSLAQNYPNPFNPTTTIRFSLPEPADVRLRVFDALGRVVATLVERSLSAGSYRVLFDAIMLPSGMYLYHLEAGNFASSQRMIVLK